MPLAGAHLGILEVSDGVAPNVKVEEDPRAVHAVQRLVQLFSEGDLGAAALG